MKAAGPGTLHPRARRRSVAEHRRRSGPLSVVLFLGALACDNGGPTGAEGNVVAAGAPVWGDTELVEQAAIGVAEGPAGQMLGEITGLALGANELFVLDRSLPAVRVYDRGGGHLRDIGRDGQGPGEFDGPYLLAISGSGDVVVRDLRGVARFDRTGTWLGHVMEPGGIVYPMSVQTDGTILVPTTWIEGRESLSGILPIASDGTRLDPIVHTGGTLWRQWQLEAHSARGSRYESIPYAPSDSWLVTPRGSVVTARGDFYRLRVQHADGTVLVIEREVPPASIPARAAEEARQLFVGRMRSVDPSWVWPDREMPTTYPFIDRIVADRDGRLFVRRAVGATRRPACGEEGPALPDGAACWQTWRAFDVFAADGRYVGEIVPPASARTYPDPAFLGDSVALPREDADGVLSVGIYEIRRTTTPAVDER